MTYKELQSKLKEYRDAGYTLQVKLNGKAVDLERELERITDIITTYKELQSKTPQPLAEPDTTPSYKAAQEKSRTIDLKRVKKEWFTLNVPFYQGKIALRKAIERYNRNKTTLTKLKKVAATLHSMFSEITLKTMSDIQYFRNICKAYAYS